MFSLVAYEDSDEEDANKSDQEEKDKQTAAEADEPSSSTSSDDSESEEKDVQRMKCSELSNVQPALPSASMMLADNKKIIPGGVFSNPFREAEDAKIASLEKHVKMVDPEHKSGDQKRKICWSYRKGRCRFGSKCSFAHDSDLIVKKELHGGIPEEADDAAAGTSIETTNHSRKQGINTNKKKRPGLSRELVPPKKVLKMYHREKYSGKP